MDMDLDMDMDMDLDLDLDLDETLLALQVGTAPSKPYDTLLLHRSHRKVTIQNKNKQTG
jgi:hypothetical protein